MESNQECKSGSWLYTGDCLNEGMCKCSECGVEVDPSEARNICPNCNTDMTNK